MSFLAMAGKQVLPDEIKIRELAEQISIKADPKVFLVFMIITHIGS